jgi:ech hydrogenase subunit A
VILLESLILFPCATALILLLLKSEWAQGLIVRFAALTIAAASVFFLTKLDLTYISELKFPFFDQLVLAGDVLLFCFILFWGIRDKRWPVIVLLLLQFIPLIIFEVTKHQELKATNPLYFDQFSVIMALIIGVIGGLIAIFAVPYMKEFHHHHQEIKDRRPLFFFIIFLFLGSMFGVVFSNNLLWLYFFWEVTTICSFILIGYKRNQESLNNAYRALIMNLMGGVGFVAAIILTHHYMGTIELSGLLAGPKTLALFPAALLAFSGMTKSAQMPFSSWLLGAMVAPTPVSALLHSSTMVKAGVFLVVKLAPIFHQTSVGMVVAMIGGLTFLSTSLLAIAQSDAKRVLAYSTIANLGLIILCAGVGSSEAVWAAILLIIFHAIAKCLLFLCVGSLENKSGSRNIESMDALIARSPMLAWLLLIGMAGMFLAPFGMLVSKWIVLRALLEQSGLMVVFIAYGSAATVFFWAKWMGRIISIPTNEQKPRFTFAPDETVSLGLLAAMVFGACLLIPWITNTLVAPYLYSSGFGMLPDFKASNFMTMGIMLAMLIIFPLPIPLIRKFTRSRQVGPYLSGANDPSLYQFISAQQKKYPIENKNYYLEKYFGEPVLFLPSVILANTALLALVVLGLLALRSNL